MRVITKPPEGVVGRGIYYPIRTDFALWLEVARLFDKGDKMSAVRAVKLCYKGKHPDDIDEALYLLAEFFCGGETSESNGERLMSFSQDEERIYASFWSEYGIDLGKTELHWWRFLALLKNLSPESALMRVVAIRAAKPSDIKNLQQRQRLIRKKRLFSLKQEHIDEGEILAELFKSEEVNKCPK